MNKGLLVVVSGPAGSGKSTVNGEITKKEGFAFSVSATTRAPRPGEADGVNYYYISREEFERRIAAGEMLEYTCYCGNYYGTPLREAEQVLASGKNLILEIAVLIMLLPPNHTIQEQRLRGRGTEPEDKVLERLARTREEARYIHRYDYIVYNHDNKIDDAISDIVSIVRAEQLKATRNPDADVRFFAD